MKTDIFLVVFRSKNSDSENVISFTDEKKAIHCASEIASKGCFSSNHEDYLVRDSKLTNIVKFNLTSLKGISCELVLDYGRFALKDKK